MLKRAREKQLDEKRAMEVIGVGIVAIDVIDEVAAFPKDATDWLPTRINDLTTLMRCRGCRGCRSPPSGGNVANALVVAAQLGCSCHWVGTTTDPARDPDAAFAHAELQEFGVDCSTSTVLSSGAMPMSYILASHATGSRTIVHYRNLDELTVGNFETATQRLWTQSPSANVWVHFEGRNMAAVLEMMHHVRLQTPRATLSVEIEALRYDWTLAKRLALASDVVFVSKDYVRDNLEYASATAFLLAEFACETSTSSERDSAARVHAVVCPWGSDGVYFLDRAATNATAPASVQHISTTALASVVESIGAGDTFIGATIAALSQHAPLHRALELACAVATDKCSRVGLTIPQAQRSTWKRAIDREAKTHDQDEE